MPPASAARARRQTENGRLGKALALDRPEADSLLGNEPITLVKYPCPCCGYLIFPEPPGSYDICEICFWEDDLSQLRFQHSTGANHVSLVEGQINFAAIGASEERVREFVRPVMASDVREKEWRQIDLASDDLEEGVSGIDYGETYPDDNTVLYYWRPTYWRLKR
jgi:hypothetical protein